MALRFLIDENLSDLLASCAHRRGYEAQYVPHVGLQQSTDAELVRHALLGDWVIVTNDAGDFLRLLDAEEVHPGIVLVITQVPPALQVVLFEAALDFVAGRTDLIDVVVRVDVDEDTKSRFDRNTRLTDEEWAALGRRMVPRVSIAP